MGKTLRDLRDIPITRLSGVTPRLEERLGMLEITNVLQLIEHYPRRYLDRTKKSDIADLRVGEEATVYAEVRKMTSRRTRQGRALVETIVYDGTSYLYVTFFNQSWRAQQLPVGTEAAFFGKLEHYRGKHQMTNPVVDVLGRIGEKTGVIVPVYPQSGKADVSTWQLQKLVAEALRRARDFEDPVPADVRDRLNLADRTRAYNGIHEPEVEADHFRAAHRLKFDEFLRMQLGLVARKRAFEERRVGLTHRLDGPLVAAFHAQLPFALTGDQQKAIAEIGGDLAAPRPMHRLLQGDVGSGKTVVALTALLTAVQGGYQGALMAPTEVLAEQHHLSLTGFLEGLTVSSERTLMGERPVRVELLTNRTGAAGRRKLSAALDAGEVDIVVGTHALIYDSVTVPALGVAVIDEQHRFGVEQRALLRAKGPGGAAREGDGSSGPEPDVLVMTATPIPRTAAMLIYGDLDKSELREMPPGRTPITTEVIPPSPLEREAAYQRLREQVAVGRQAYVVCPLVEGSEKVEAKAATEEAERLQAEELSGLKVGLLHGQMPPADKEATMARFRAGLIDVLVATTVIEVGVDVPNATVLVVEDADRFGLSQLHQLRGRVGRGGGESWCFLFADPQTPEAEARLQAMADSTDGFLLAERDLEIRGAGEVFGERQAGFTDLKLGRIPRDEPVVIEARRVAEEILDADPGLGHHRRLAEEVEDLLGDDVEFLFKS
ncbi:MAG TPA: ATP-dependent DNA helicase RecG [Acidimicrobiia bacterium]|nr:ATP-dependent DNA helicase RecG [Acidimicrobiia bacterium]